MPLREQLAGGRIKGTMLKARFAFVEERGGEAAKRGLLQDLTREQKAAISPMILVSNWYPFRLLVAIDRAIEQRFGTGDGKVLRELGMKSARLNLSDSYQAFRSESPHAFFLRSAALHHLFQDFGSVKYESLGERSAVLTICSAACYSKVHCWSAQGYYEEVLRLHGGTGPKVTEVECACESGPDCKFRLLWY